MLLILLGRLPCDTQLNHSQEEVFFNERIKNIDLLDLYNLELTTRQLSGLKLVWTEGLWFRGSRRILCQIFPEYYPLPANRILLLKSLTWTLFFGKFDVVKFGFHKKKVWNLLWNSSALKGKSRCVFRILVAFALFLC